MAEPQSTATSPTKTRVRNKARLEEVEFQFDFIRKSFDKRQPMIPVFDECIRHYMVSPGGLTPTNWQTVGSASMQRGDYAGYGSVLKDPEANQIVDSLTSQAIGQLMPNLEYIQAMPVGSDDTEKARYVARLLMGILQAPLNYDTNFLGFKDGFMVGTSIVQIGWETLARQEVVENPVFDDKTGMLIGREAGIDSVVYRDHPLIQLVDVYDFYPDPSGTRIQKDMLGVAKRFRISKGKARRLAKAGVYNKEQVELAIASVEADTRGNTEGQMSDNRFGNDMETHQPNVTADKYGMLTGFEFWGEYPGTMPSDGARNRVITTLEGHWVRSHINPYLGGDIPFKEIIPNPVHGRFWGLSVIEVIRFLQDSADALLMVYTDAADLAARNILLVGNAAKVKNMNQLRDRQPNDVISCMNPDMIKPLPFDTGTLGFAAQEYMRRIQRMQNVSGASLPQMIAGQDRPVATGVAEMARLSSERTDLSVQLIERSDYPWIGKTIHRRLKQFLSPRREEILAGERFPMTLDEIDIEADIKFVGTRQAESKFQRAAQWREFTQTVGNNIEMLAYAPEVLVRYGRDGLGVPDAEEIIMKIAKRLENNPQFQALLSGGNGQGGSPPAPNNNLSGTVAGTVEQEGVALA